MQKSFFIAVITMAFAALVSPDIVLAQDANLEREAHAQQNEVDADGHDHETENTDDDGHRGAAHGEGDHHHAHDNYLFLAIIVMVVLGRCGALVEKVGLPAVVGELAVGMLAANVPRAFGIDLTGELLGDFVVFVFMQFGVKLLLFYTGLEEDLRKMMGVGLRAVVVALIGVALPFAAGYAMSAFVFWPGEKLVTHCFIGATLVATSVGITAAIFNNLSYKSPTRTLVVGAAVVDDVIGLVILAVVSAMAMGQQVTAAMVGGQVGMAAAFLIGSVVVGLLAAPIIGRALSAIHPGVNMKQGMALLFCAVYAYAAYKLAGLEPIVGAFAAGLVLAPAHFNWFDTPYQAIRAERWVGKLHVDQHQLREEMEELIEHKKHSHVEGLIQDLVKFFVPIYFVGTGMKVDLSVFLDLNVLLVAAAFTVVAILGKLPCGLAAGKNASGWIVGWSMVARGEVGLVFANMGQERGVFTDEIFAVLVVVVTLTTFIPPLFLPGLIRRDQERLAAEVE